MYLQNLPILTAAMTIIFVFLAGGVVKGALGFGLPLITMALLTNFISVQAALVINALVIPFANITQFVQARLMLETIRRFRYLLGGLVLGAPVGAYLVNIVHEPILLLVLGVFVLLFSSLSLVSPRIVLLQRHMHSSGTVVGLIAGIVGALTTTNGPVLVMYLVSLGEERRMFLSALGLFFIVTGIMISSSFLAVGLINVQLVILAALALPSVLLGMLLGNAIGSRIPARIFQIGVVGVLSILGVNLILRGFAGL